jgi:uridine phosphorylase
VHALQKNPLISISSKIFILHLMTHSEYKLITLLPKFVVFVRIMNLSDDCVFSPSDFIKYLANRSKISLNKIRVPSQVIITYQRSVYEYAKRLVNGNPVDWWIYDEIRPLCIGKYRGSEIAVDNIWVGAPAAIMTLEELIACGAKTIFEIGICGGLQSAIQSGEIIVVTEAIRDEGTSLHYLPPEDLVKSSEHLRSNLIKNLTLKNIKHHVGSIWSTDGVYREICEKLRKFRDAGVLGVNMETSAIFAVGQFRNVEVASAQVISDILTEKEWHTHFHHQSVKENTQTLVKTILETLSQN